MAGTTEYPYAQAWTLIPNLYHNEVNAREIIDLNVIHKTIKFLEERWGKYLYDLGLDNNFLNINHLSVKKILVKQTLQN